MRVLPPNKPFAALWYERPSAPSSRYFLFARLGHSFIERLLHGVEQICRVG
jgi:hypothetical protein